jgi:hypothetical protein
LVLLIFLYTLRVQGISLFFNKIIIIHQKKTVT